jgi:hypothetical protein
LIVSPKHNELLKDSVSYTNNVERCRGYERERETERARERKLPETAIYRFVAVISFLRSVYPISQKKKKICLFFYRLPKNVKMFFAM